MLVFAASICRLALESEERRKWSKLIFFCVQDILLQLRSQNKLLSPHLEWTYTHAQQYAGDDCLCSCCVRCWWYCCNAMHQIFRCK